MAAASDVWVLYRREVRAALRDRTVVVNSVLIPLFLFPLLLWAMFTAISFWKGQTEGTVSRVAIVAAEEQRGALLKQWQLDERLELLAAPIARREAERRLQAETLDAVLLLEPVSADHPGLPPVPGNLAGQILFDNAKDRSAAAAQRIEDKLERHRQRFLDRQAAALGVPAAAWEGFRWSREDQSTKREVGAMVLGLMVPLFLVLNVAIGCIFPAIDATAGERERKTWETLMSCAVRRSSILTAKYLYVVTFGTAAALLNLTAMVLSMGALVAPLVGIGERKVEFALPLVGIPVIVVGTVLLAAILGAGMMILAAFARTFKEGQSLVTPLYLAAVVPVMFLTVPGLSLDARTAAIPIVGVTLMFREAIAGTFQWPHIAIVIAVELIAIWLCLRIALWIMRFEEFVVGGRARHVFQLWRRSKREPS